MLNLKITLVLASLLTLFGAAGAIENNAPLMPSLMAVAVGAVLGLLSTMVEVKE